MGCGCKKTKVEEITPQPTPDVIKIETNGEDIKETGTEGDNE
jgi:hypothetical protein